MDTTVTSISLKIGGAPFSFSFDTPTSNPEPIQLDETRMWGYCPNDYELHEYFGKSVWSEDGKNRDGYNRFYPKTHGDPSTVITFKKEDKVVMTAAWQWFVFRSCFVFPCFGHFDETKLSAQDLTSLKNSWGSVMQGNRVITNNTGPTHNNPDNPGDGYRDVIRNLHGDQPFFRIMPLLMSGTIVELTGKSQRPNSLFGDAWEFRCLDGTKAPPNPEDFNFIRTPEYFSIATNVRYAFPSDNIQGLANEWQHVIPFPQNDWRNAHVVLPNIANGSTNLVPKNRCAVWKNGFVPNPYNPPLQKYTP